MKQHNVFLYAQKMFVPATLISQLKSHIPMFDLLHFVNENNEKQFIIIVDINIGIFNVRDESSVYSFIHFI